MMIDREIRLRGHDATEFKNMMEDVDIESLALRDEFIQGISLDIDDKGILCVQCPELNVDLSCLQNKTEIIESAIILEDRNNYIDKVSVQVTYGHLNGYHDIALKNKDYKNDVCYVKLAMNNANQSEAIRYAA